MYPIAELIIVAVAGWMAYGVACALLYRVRPVGRSPRASVRAHGLRRRSGTYTSLDHADSSD